MPPGDWPWQHPRHADAAMVEQVGPPPPLLEPELPLELMPESKPGPEPPPSTCSWGSSPEPLWMLQPTRAASTRAEEDAKRLKGRTDVVPPRGLGRQVPTISILAQGSTGGRAEA